jgi:hypothetical protein
MNCDVWTSRSSLRRPRSLLAAAALLLSIVSLSSLVPPALAQTIQPVTVEGRIIWTNEDTQTVKQVPEIRPAKEPAGRSTASSQQLFYWDKSDGYWKPVSPVSPSAMRSAQAIAGAVSSYIESRPRLGADAKPIHGEPASQDPNYTQAAGDRSVSSGQIDRYINEAAARHHVDPNLVRALVKVESNFNPRAVSRKGAMGLMQLMPATARKYELHNPFDAAQNVDAGVRHLKGLLDSYRGDVPLTLAAYNAGEGAVERSGGIPPYTETRNYVRRITSLMATTSGPLPAVSIAVPVELRRDERGHLVISNTD